MKILLFLISSLTFGQYIGVQRVASVDASGNVMANAFAPGYATTVSAAGTTTLTVASAQKQFVTGTTTQIYTLPVTSTFTATGAYLNIVNGSTGLVTVNSSGGNPVVALFGGTSATLVCILTSGTSAASWGALYNGVIVATGKGLTVSNTLTFTGTDGSSVAFGAGGTVLYNGGALGTPGSGNGGNLTNLPLSSMTGAGINVVTFLTTPSGANFNSMIAAGGIPVNCSGTCSKSAAYTTVLGDGGGTIVHASSDNNARTFTIDSNANVAYPLYTVITIVNLVNTVTIAITSDTMTLAGTASTGNRTLAVNGIATLYKIGTTSWLVSGPGVT